jgi:hypothetical protein
VVLDLVEGSCDGVENTMARTLALTNSKRQSC